MGIDKEKLPCFTGTILCSDTVQSNRTLYSKQALVQIAEQLSKAVDCEFKHDDIDVSDDAVLAIRISGKCIMKEGVSETGVRTVAELVSLDSVALVNPERNSEY